MPSITQKILLKIICGFKCLSLTHNTRMTLSSVLHKDFKQHIFCRSMLMFNNSKNDFNFVTIYNNFVFTEMIRWSIIFTTCIENQDNIFGAKPAQNMYVQMPYFSPPTLRVLPNVCLGSISSREIDIKSNSLSNPMMHPADRFRTIVIIAKELTA